jgi:hypothetical protein
LLDGCRYPGKNITYFFKRRWSASYQTFVSNTSNELQQARNLLNDYTRGESACLRFLHGNWNRHHIEEIARLVYRIDHGLIAHLEDLKYELEQIKLTNETGSLARRFSFIASISAMEDPESDNDIILEPCSENRRLGH